MQFAFYYFPFKLSCPQAQRSANEMTAMRKEAEKSAREIVALRKEAQQTAMDTAIIRKQLEALLQLHTPAPYGKARALAALDHGMTLSSPSTSPLPSAANADSRDPQQPAPPGSPLTRVSSGGSSPAPAATLIPPDSVRPAAKPLFPLPWTASSAALPGCFEGSEEVGRAGSCGA
mmetsp:Transcript_19417/g.53935  ORF Transcript_19417/g.53935 Transcript_19417/m.53935 type:complete len:175 (+) Transcript_19417:2538-3062(+)